MDSGFGSNADYNSLGLTSLTLFAYIISAVSLSTVAMVVAICAGISTIAYNIYRMIKNK
jgi:hypothetical protein